jgi:hypothetical protein
MKTYYVSLVRDLIGAYLEVDADSEITVKKYLACEYLNRATGAWALPWCSVYSDPPEEHYGHAPIIIRRRDGALVARYVDEDYEAMFGKRAVGI